MKAVPFVLAALQGIVIGGCAMSERPQVAPYEAVHEYRLAPGDQIRVVVFDQPTLSASYSIDASGTVSIPLAGAFKAENKTVRQIESSIGKALKDKNLVADPKVTVEVAIYRPFSILGEVRAPGRFPYAPGMTIEAAVALAGGYTNSCRPGSDTCDVSCGRCVGDRLSPADWKFSSPAIPST